MRDHRPGHPSSSWLAATTFAAVAAVACGSGCAATPADEWGDLAQADGREDALGEGARYTLWIHGRSTGGAARVGDYDDFSYWGSGDAAAGVNKKAVNWDGAARISESNGAVRRALDCFCTGPSSCYVAAHSAGNLQIGYALDLYGGTKREITDGRPDASGACGSAGAGTQVGWNIHWVDVAGGAAGGTELADLGYWAVSDELTSDLRTTTARALYDHNDTRSTTFYMFAGANGAAYAGVLPGQDDEVIAYHSAGGLSGVGSFCNPGDELCHDVLHEGGVGSTRGGAHVPKWANHSTYLRDDGEIHDHHTRGAWGGIVSAVVEDLEAYTN